MGDNDTPDARSVDRTEHSGPAGTAPDSAPPADASASPPTGFAAAGPPILRSEQLRRLADTAAAALALPTPAVDHERTLPAEALARVLDAVEASTVSSATLDGTDSPRYLALERRVSGLRHQLTVPNSVVRRCQTIRQFTT